MILWDNWFVYLAIIYTLNGYSIKCKSKWEMKHSSEIALPGCETMGFIYVLNRALNYNKIQIWVIGWFRVLGASHNTPSLSTACIHFNYSSEIALPGCEAMGFIYVLNRALNYNKIQIWVIGWFRVLGASHNTPSSSTACIHFNSCKWSFHCFDNL